ncbi:L-fucokinase-domain-containing protein [Gamsiella multidivaricata]|uniref:L-fucokinase-domain-containing protein n=1 Tax=Gamsiella multidivaricata TaxID=101098 RepID=UPI00221FAC3C|nr:L-fucokinase-domain-containing protein [Gamsiella multidivaricata]KAI7828978.1 L-fucokinase-domain-containing protein [Gamsiella multidivaricata]
METFHTNQNSTRSAPGGIDALSRVLHDTHAQNLATYKRLLAGQPTATTTTTASRDQDPFWDVVVVTAGDVQQRLVYELRINQKLERRDIPTHARYHVIEDPPSSKIGSGGSTFLVMKALKGLYSQDFLSNARILLIHAGGYSTRLPHVSARGKVFMTLPQADSQNGIQVLELKLVLYLHLLTCMPPGVFLTSADGIELFSSKASFPSDPKPLTITALAHPSSTQIGSTHGVYLLHDPKGLVTEDRRRGPSDQSALMLKCQQFLHKPKLDVMKGTTGVIHSDLAKAEADVVYTDSCYYFDPQTADIMATTYDMLSAECDLEAWADILSFQDLPTSVPHPSSNSSTTTDNPYLRGRQKAKRALQDAGVVLDVMVLNASKFYHLGTMQEFLAGTCTDLPFMFELNIQNDVDGIALVQVFNGTASAVDCMHSPAYIERSSVSPNILIGSHSIVVDCNLPADAVIPRDTCMFTLQLQEHEFVTFTFSVKDDMKKVARTTKEFGNALQELRVFEHVPVSEMFDPSIGYPSECEGEVSLWTAVIFETARSEEESVEFARNRLDRIRHYLREGEPGAGIGIHQGARPLATAVDWVSLKDAARRARHYWTTERVRNKV